MRMIFNNEMILSKYWMSFMINKNTKICCLVFLTTIFIFGCASIPKESVILSEELTSMILSARDSHLAIVEGYFNEKRKQVDKFLDKEWTPDYMDDFVKTSGVLKDYENAKSENEKHKIMNDFAKAASEEIYKRRMSMIDGLNKIENQCKHKIEEHYSNMLLTNQSLTAHLRSATKVTTTRNKLMNKLKILPEEILPLNKIEEKLEPIMEYKGKIEDLKSVFGGINMIIREGK